MRGLKLLLWTVCAVLLCVSLSEAGRFRASSGCSGGACAVSAQPLPSDSEVAVRWPWSKPAPAPVPTPAPPVVQPPPLAPAGGIIIKSTVSAEVRRPIVRAAAAPVRAVAAAAKAIHNRDHKPVLRAVKAIVGHQRRAARR
jgi:hypothetical protein